jgi:uncharacterized membrane protein
MKYGHYFAGHVGGIKQGNTLIVKLKKVINTSKLIFISLQVKIAFCVYCTGICYTASAKLYRLN